MIACFVVTEMIYVAVFVFVVLLVCFEICCYHYSYIHIANGVLHTCNKILFSLQL